MSHDNFERLAAHAELDAEQLVKLAKALQAVSKDPAISNLITTDLDAWKLERQRVRRYKSATISVLLSTGLAGLFFWHEQGEPVIKPDERAPTQVSRDNTHDSPLVTLIQDQRESEQTPIANRTTDDTHKAQSELNLKDQQDHHEEKKTPVDTDSAPQDSGPQTDPRFIELPRERIPIRDIVRNNDRKLATNIAAKAPDRNVDRETLRGLLDDPVVASYIEYINKANGDIASNRPIIIPWKFVLDIAEGQFPLLRQHPTISLYGAIRSPSGPYTPAPTQLLALSVEDANSWLDGKAHKERSVTKSRTKTNPSIKTVTIDETATWIQKQ